MSRKYACMGVSRASLSLLSPCHLGFWGVLLCIWDPAEHFVLLLFLWGCMKVATILWEGIRQSSLVITNSFSLFKKRRFQLGPPALMIMTPYCYIHFRATGLELHRTDMYISFS